MTAPHRELINAAAQMLRPQMVGDRLFGDVASTLVTAAGHRYFGVCIDTGSGTGFCAEHSAIAAMVTAGEYQIRRIVAVWRDEQDLYTCFRPVVDAENSSVRSIRPTSTRKSCWASTGRRP